MNVSHNIIGIWMCLCMLLDNPSNAVIRDFIGSLCDDVMGVQ